MQTMGAMFSSGGGQAATTAMTVSNGQGGTDTTQIDLGDGGGSFGGNFGGADALSFLGGGVAALGQLQAGKAEAAQLEAQADLLEIQAEGDELAGRRDALNANIALNRAINRNLASGFASGLRSSGSVAQASEDAIDDTELLTDLTKSSARIRSLAKQQSATNARRRADSRREASKFNAAKAVFDPMMLYLRRG